MIEKKSLTILHVEDSDFDAENLQTTLAKVPIVNKCIWAKNHDEAKQVLENDTTIGLVLIDYFIDNVCLDLTKEKNQSFIQYCISKNIPVIYLSGSADPQTAIEAYEQGALTFLPKPLKISQFVAVIKGINTLGLEIVKIK